MTGPKSDQDSLLVPVSLQAWSVAPSAQEPVCVSVPDYLAMRGYRDPLPDPLAVAGAGAAVPGIHLRWELPRALTQGEYAAGETEFPLVPNRWMVTRCEADGESWRCTKVTVVQSDWLDPVDGANPYLDPGEPSSPQQVHATRIGRSVDLQTWEAGGDPGGELFLRAVAPCDLWFSSYTPFMRDVFSYVDPAGALADPTAGVSRYAYCVVGWYSDPDRGDPLRAGGEDGDDARGGFLEVLARLDWTVPGLTSWLPEVWPEQASWRRARPEERLAAVLAHAGREAPPDTTLYHGAVHGVEWPARSAVPDPGQVRVAFANSTVDALVAWVEAEGPPVTGESRGELGRLLRMAQLALLPDQDRAGGDADTADKAQRAWFDASPGGTAWAVAAARPQVAGERAEQPEPSPAQLASLAAQLAELNRRQRLLDASARELAAQQAELYRQWWKNGLAELRSGEDASLAYAPGPLYPLATTPQWFAQSPPGAPVEYDYGEAGGLRSFFQSQLYPAQQRRVWALHCEVQALAATLPDPADPAAIAVWAEEHIRLPDGEGGTTSLAALGLSLGAQPEPAFQAPGDPIVLFSGAERTRQPREGLRARDRGLLRCRLPGRTIRGFQVDGAPIVVGELPRVHVDPLAGCAHVPGVSSLLAELCCADPQAAAIIAAASGRKRREFAPPEEGAWPHPGWLGEAPAPQALTDWEQAWSPLVLEWSLRYYPTGSGAGLARRFASADWTFDGERFAWAGTGYDPGYGTPYSGQVLVTPQAPHVLAGQVAALLADDPEVDPAELERVVEEIAGWDILSESLAGLSDQLLTLDSVPGFPPSPGQPLPCPPAGPLPDPGALIDGHWGSTPQTANTSDARLGGGRPDFYPVRGGFAVIERLRLVDAFGQVLDLASPNAPQGFLPILGEDLRPTDPQDQLPTGALQLSPRLPQSSRLDFRLLSANGSGHPLRESPDPQPICGWLIPNHLDATLLVYAADGQPLGELTPAGPPDNWRPAPGPAGERPPPQSPGDIANAGLRAVVSSLAAQSARVFADCLQVLDATLWMVDPLGGRADARFSTLIGRPLAVVLARLKLELGSSPTVCQHWQAMAEGTSGGSGLAAPPWHAAPRVGGVVDTPFEVSLGNLELRDDGLVGYYLGDDTQVLNVVHRPASAGESDDYLRPIGPGNFISLTCAPEDAATVTMIVDPRGEVHARSGILPPARTALPAGVVENLLDTLRLRFRAGPLLCTAGTLRLPVPAQEQAGWEFLASERPPEGDLRWSVAPIVEADETARLPSEPPQLREGWYRLVVE